jgi:serine/threonine protein kinase
VRTLPLLAPGDTVRGTYTVERFLGCGAFAEVYLVSHRYLGQQALKAFRPVTGELGLEELLSEARTLVDLTHPNIVRLYDANVDSSRGITFAFVTMEWCSAGTLADRLETVTRLQVAETVQIGIQVCAGLGHTHSMDPPLLHLDVKPANLLLFGQGPKPDVKLADYGLASRLDPVTRLSRSGGTLAFAAPEMAWGVLDERADVYSLGVTLYRAACGIHPFPLVSPDTVSATSEFRAMLGRSRKDIKPPSKLLLSDMPQLDEVLLTAMAFDPFRRYRNANEFGAALKKLASSLECGSNL